MHAFRDDIKVAEAMLFGTAIRRMKIGLAFGQLQGLIIKLENWAVISTV